MINVNHVVLVGRLTKDIELRKTNSNISTCSFTVAVDKRFASQQAGGQTADFINVFENGCGPDNHKPSHKKGDKKL